MTKCVICERRPANGGGNGYCLQCASELDAVAKAKAKDQPQSFLTYRGHVVGLYRNGRDTLTPRLLQRSPENLPKRNTIDLNTYLPGFTRTRIKEFKACVLSLVNA